MPHRHHTRRITALAAAATLGLAALAATGPAPAQAKADVAAKAKARTAHGLTADDRLVRFRVGDPGGARVVGKVRGLRQDDALVGIDVRPANGQLYGVGDEGGIYRISVRNARATLTDRLTVDLQGRQFGVDWNPTVDALRIISDSGQNLRFAPSSGDTTEDAVLNTPDVSDRVRGMSGAAYTNNDRSEATGTALYDLNTTTDSLALQVPANAGTITGQGPLGAQVAPAAGFDIASQNRGDRTVNNTGYAVLTVDGRTGLYTVNLTSGKVTRAGAFPNRLTVTDLAIATR